jgi:glycosyltransferase involved in cell wall biosynthesis
MIKKGLIIIPCFNEEQNIIQLLHDLNQISIPNIDLVFLPINDGSKDKTLTNIISKTNNYLHLINNLGIGGAVQSGIKYAYANNFDFAIQLDGDGQHPANELIKIINNYQKTNCDLCIGSRYIHTDGFRSTFLRRLGIGFLNKIIYISTGQKVYDCTSGFRLYGEKAMQLFSNYYPDKYPEPESIVYAILNKLKIAEVAVVMQERKNGKTSISGFSTVFYMLKVSLAILFLKLNFTINHKF